MTEQHYIACDLGAESGRVLLGTLSEDHITIEEVHRFPNGGVDIDGSLRWDIGRIFDELKSGLRLVARRKIQIESISCDSWGVDYVLLDDEGGMHAPPYHYRDSRTNDAFEKAFRVVPADAIFSETGIQFMPINTLYQLHADLSDRPSPLKATGAFLMIGDYFNFLLSGVSKAEESLASTSQLYNPRLRCWSASLIQDFEFPPRIFPDVVPSGTVLGPLLPAIAEEVGLVQTIVVASCSHDTGAAVAAVPGSADGWAYLSSGTWSLLGVEVSRPIITQKSRAYNFTNEIGYGGSIRFLKNIVGLWVLQECRRAWANEGNEYSYDELTRIAGMASPLQSMVDLTDQRFMKSENMPRKIIDYCRETNQPIPASTGEIVRCVLESLALSYRRTLEQLEDATGQPIATLHIVGGGSKNRLLNQLSANATGRSVVVGPVECTGIGNVLVQALALGHLPKLQAARSIVRSSFTPERFEPLDGDLWREAYRKFDQLSQHL